MIAQQQETTIPLSSNNKKNEKLFEDERNSYDNCYVMCQKFFQIIRFQVIYHEEEEDDIFDVVILCFRTHMASRMSYHVIKTLQINFSYIDRWCKSSDSHISQSTAD